MLSKKELFLKTVKAALIVSFLFFSFQSVSDFVNGKYVYDIINEKDDQLVFPSITLCPKQKRQMVHLNVEKLGEDFPSKTNFDKLEGYGVYTVIGKHYPDQSFDLVKNYSFSNEELSIEVDGMMVKKFGTSKWKKVDPKDYEEENRRFQESLNPDQYFQQFPGYVVPVSYKEIIDYRGRCFNFQTSEVATLEKEYQGLTLNLSPEVEWNVFLGPPGVVYPTLTPQSKSILSFFTLRKSTQTIMTFFSKKYVKLKRTKPFHFKDLCEVGSDFSNYIKCEKECFLDTFNVICFTYRHTKNELILGNMLSSSF